MIGNKQAVSTEAIHKNTGNLKIALLTGGFDQPYAFGLSTALADKGVRLEVIGSDKVDGPQMHSTPGLTFLNLLPGWHPNLPFTSKIAKVLRFYARLLLYAATAQPKVFHILWNNNAVLFDRIILMLVYKLCGKKIALTAHNVNAGQRDGTDSVLNRLTLKSQYRLVDRIFVHTQKMRSELVTQFGVSPESVTVIPFGINNSVPHTDLTRAEARQRLGIKSSERALLFFGNVRSYKGLEYLIEAMTLLTPAKGEEYSVIIAGELNKDYTLKWMELQNKINSGVVNARVLQKIEYIPDSETEVYFKAADVSILPYTYVYQSGVLFLGYSFGLPAIATGVGSFAEDIVDGRTGFVCKPCDAADLARAIAAYFESDLYRNLDTRRLEIRDYATERHSWDVVGDMTCQVYADLLREERR